MVDNKHKATYNETMNKKLAGVVALMGGLAITLGIALYPSKARVLSVTPTQPFSARIAEQASRLGIGGCVVEDRYSAHVARYSAERDCILISTSASGYSDEVLAFVLAHEYAHKTLRHAQRTREAVLGLNALYKAETGKGFAEIAGTDELLSSMKRDFELEADAEAASVLISQGRFNLAAVASILGSEPETLNHPAASVRLEALAALIQGRPQ